MKRSVDCALLVWALVTFSEGRAQNAPSNQLPTDSGRMGTAEQEVVSGAVTRPSTETLQGTLSPEQIRSILDDNPDLREVLKLQVAHALQQQGTQVEPEEISDDLLDEQIAASPQVNRLVSRYLEARGFSASSGTVSSAKPSDAGLSPHVMVSGSGIRSIPCESGERCAAPIVTQPEDSAIASPPFAIRKPAPYPLQAMRDLYEQVPEPSGHLKRFGSDFFLNRGSTLRGGTSADVPLDVPVGPDYVIGPGDSLEISTWGGSTQTLSRTVGRDGRLMLPEAGSLQVAGLTLERAWSAIAAALKQQYRNVQVAVTVAHFHTVRIYIAGDVQRPGGYDVSALATPLSALYAAGGPTAVGSLRTVRHLRGTEVVEEIDLYQFLLQGVHGSPVRLESGDTLLVPPVGAQVSISGAVKRPAVYELKSGSSPLGEVIEDAGGFTAAASVSHISVERVDAHLGRETVTVPMSQGATVAGALHAVHEFAVKDGDRVVVGPVLPYSERLVYLEGHVTRPGRQPYREGMRLSDVVGSYADLLPEPADQAEIVRLVGPDLHAETIPFGLREALIGDVNPTLEAFDTIRVRGRYDEDAPQVTVRGEVQRPGVYPLSDGMTAGQLVHMAGGFKRDALLERADIASYSVTNGNEVSGTLRTVKIGDAAEGREQDVKLQPGDILTVHQITGWGDIGQAVTVEGQVKFPGSYGFVEGERLSSVLRRAGGFRISAYPEGAALVREQARDLESKSRDELIRQIETNAASARLSPNLGTGETGPALQLIKAQKDEIVGELQSHPPTGRLVVHISENIDSWANTPADLELRSGDVLTIPKRPGFVLVTGQVYNTTAVTYTPDKSAGWYLARAGGASTTANRKEIFVIRANGSVVGRRSGGWFEADVLSLKLNAGDVVVVPQKIIGSSLLWRNLLTTAQIASSIAITAAVAGL